MERDYAKNYGVVITMFIKLCPLIDHSPLIDSRKQQHCGPFQEEATQDEGSSRNDGQRCCAS